MNRTTLTWILAGLAVLGVAVVTVMLGQTLLPPRATAQTIGTLVPWYITWGMIWGTALIAVIIAINLFAVGLNNGRAHSMPVRSNREPAQ
jgi:uncharacterized membrane protein